MSQAVLQPPRRRLIAGSALGIAAALALVQVRAWPQAQSLADDEPAILVVRVTDEVLQRDVSRVGMNVGTPNTFAAGHLQKNRITNPGFEPGLFATVFKAGGTSAGGRVPVHSWNATWNKDEGLGVGWPESFWDRAGIEVLSGAGKGFEGNVAAFRIEGQESVFYLPPSAPPISPGDVLVVRKHVPGYFRTYNLPDAHADLTRTRPGSPGVQSLRLEAPENARAVFWQTMDTAWGTTGHSSGKLVIVDGAWVLSFWAQGEREGDLLRVRFRRAGERTFVDKALTIGPSWREHRLEFFAPPGDDPVGPYPPGSESPGLILEMYLPRDGQRAWIDDALLARADETNPTAFTDPLVARFQELRPAVLRHLSLQFGGNLENQLAEPWARRTTGWHPARRVAQYHDYSLHEFLELCREVGADPWYCVPASWRPSDLRGLVEYLAADAAPGRLFAARREELGQPLPWTRVFGTIHLEFGNEAWGGAQGGDPFWGYTVGGPRELAEIGDDRLGILRSSPHFDAARFDLILGTNVNSVFASSQLVRAENADTIAFAPYFGHVERFATDEELFGPLFARPFQDVTTGKLRQAWDLMTAQDRDLRMAVYELNFHTTRTRELPLEIRNDFVTSQAGAVALPLHMLAYMKAYGATLQCGFTSLGYAFPIFDEEHVRIWGCLRDTEATGRKRPTWLGLELVNRVIAGDMVATHHAGPRTSWVQQPMNRIERPIRVEHVQSFAFRDGPRYGLVLFNLSLDRTIPVRLDVPGSPSGALSLQVATPDIHADNEEREEVRLRARPFGGFRDGAVVDLPPHSVSALVWRL